MRQRGHSESTAQQILRRVEGARVYGDVSVFEVELVIEKSGRWEALFGSMKTFKRSLNDGGSASTTLNKMAKW